MGSPQPAIPEHSSSMKAAPSRPAEPEIVASETVHHPKPGAEGGTAAGAVHRTIADFSLTPFQRLTYTRLTVVLGFAAGFLLSSKLWVSTRYYPLIPAVHGLPPIVYPLDYICAAVLFLLLWPIALAARPRAYILSFAALLVFLALYDQTRWQPWAYLYLFLLLSLACFSWEQSDLPGQTNTLNICRLILVATYFYSGLQKMNAHFAAIGVKSLLGPLAAMVPMPHVVPWIMASFELLIAVGLLLRRWRNVAVVCGVTMHLFILFSGVVLMHWNSIVWPWNVAMAAFLVLLFWKADFSVTEVLWRNPIVFQKAVLLLFGVLPLLSFLGLWDSYLSASLYSANVPQADIFFRGDVKSQLPPPVQKYVQELPAGTNALVIRDWAMGELNVPPYPAMRAFRVIGADVCKYSQNSPDVVLVMLEKDTLLRKGRQTHDTCLGTLMVKKW